MSHDKSTGAGVVELSSRMSHSERMSTQCGTCQLPILGKASPKAGQFPSVSLSIVIDRRLIVRAEKAMIITMIV